MTKSSEPRNPFYILLLIVSLLFVITALAMTMDLFVERKTIAVAPSAFRDFLRAEGWQLLLYELGAVVVLALSSMGLDRLRRLHNDRVAATLPPPGEQQKAP
jgi:hypothetical protein